MGCVAVGDEEIGQILPPAPPAPDHIWPVVAAREVIEAVRRA
jgi:hypothetical protein